MFALAAAACVGTIGGEPGAEKTAEDPAGLIPAQPMHRLNQLEYNNTVRDLLGTSSRPADAFPPDGEAEGFDNNAAALQLTPTLLDRYFTAARAVIDEALDERPAYAFDYRSDELKTAAGYAVGDLWALSNQPITVTIDVPAGGATARLRVGASQIGTAPAPTLKFSLDGAEVETFVVPGTAAALETVSHALDLTAGSHELRYEPMNYMNEPVANNSNNVLVHSLVVEADARIEGAGRELVFVCEPTDADDPCVEQVIDRFARRAWRRPLTDTEQASLHGLFDELASGGESTEQAIRLVMRAVMTSPKFLYRVRTLADDDTEGWLDPYTLASRLSYFLWSSMPDERLFRAAADGELSSLEGLRETVSWMLEDDKAEALGDGFAEQYLATRLLEQASPSPEVFPSFDDELRGSMVAESKAFFFDFVGNGLPVSDFLDPDFAYVDARLAEHYRLVSDEIHRGDGMVRVSAAEGDRRGLLSLGAWLTAQSESERASPIKRGRWVSDSVLCEPVPPPPAGLEIEPLEIGEGGLTVREALEQHRDDPACATCHVLLDVLGMGFEGFDGVGRPRIHRGGIDTVGELPGGATFETPDELVSLLDDQTFVRCLTRKLFTYAMGRRVLEVDEERLDAVAEEASLTGRSLPDLIVEIVSLPAFRAPAPLSEEGSP